ncbi:hypothetical protein QKV36_gp106 [Erannis ankeraria nucleopolyhedrovirus]|uniref:hypothetical protein n=1 Tax=Erannis ankeraria nucleopolyhedrovirus TaxID=2913600 RepID=UPI002481F0F0|nr:hypothetical protein QKV36_gp106 [Erannis ankeraria nucleopolyhedrovirus]UJZ89054.1 hypothetical protein Erangp106 [Erannis ankeraria nucleopolyhedrovirus]
MVNLIINIIAHYQNEESLDNSINAKIFEKTFKMRYTKVYCKKSMTRKHTNKKLLF